jgi:hypothetical protein
LGQLVHDRAEYRLGSPSVNDEPPIRRLNRATAPEARGRLPAIGRTAQLPEEEGKMRIADDEWLSLTVQSFLPYD